MASSANPKPPILVAIDGTWLIHRAWHVRPSSVQFMVLGWVCQFIVETKATHALVAFDAGRSFRHDVMEGYKGKRPAKVEGVPSPSDCTGPTVKYLQGLKIHCELGRTVEADDILHTSAIQFPELYGGYTVQATPDKDNHQGLHKQCHILKPGSIAKGGNTIFDMRSLKELTGLTPEQYLDYQTLIGDSTDSIPAIMTPAVAKNLILKHKSLKRYMQRNLEWTNDNSDLLVRNRKLVKLLPDCFELTPEEYKVSSIVKGRTDVRSSFYQQLSTKGRSLF